MYYCYILFNSSIGKYYIGQTSNLEARIRLHNKYHHAKYTSKQLGLWVLKYSESFETRSEATKREIYLKSMKSKLYLQRLIEQSR